ncbi:M20/M25/M40 family metallo-hydrolase [Pseudonocardiaceae bacterium YIM PH 21723]|nr:M20/M25/M40 family metallo-hydrolase [Pseudonocardiaceae bacterium YIM PH 21723]
MAAAAGQAPSRELRDLLSQIDERRIEHTVRTLVSFGTRHTLSAQNDPKRGIGAARDWLLAEFGAIAATSDGRFTAELQSYVQQPDGDRIPVPTTITNVLGTLRGTGDPQRVYVVSGHYDSRCSNPLDFTSDAPGADDDASGVAVVLEAARVLARHDSEATIIFAAVAGEEQNLYGARHLAQQLKAAGKTVHGMFTNDIVGSSTAHDGTKHPNTVRLFAEGVPTAETPAQAAIRQKVGGENDSTSRQLGRFTKDVAAGMDVRVVHRRDRYLRGGDHIPFLELGWPALRFTEAAENYAHQHQDVRVENGVQYGDLIEFCDFGYMAKVAKVNLSTLWSLAQAPAAPVGAKLVTKTLAQDTTIVWDRGTEPDLAGYEVVVRETTDNDWTEVHRVGDVTTATFALSKDDVFFGVRAVDRDGHRSPVSFPAPSG